VVVIVANELDINVLLLGSADPNRSAVSSANSDGEGAFLVMEEMAAAAAESEVSVHAKTEDGKRFSSSVGGGGDDDDMVEGCEMVEFITIGDAASAAGGTEVVGAGGGERGGVSAAIGGAGGSLLGGAGACRYGGRMTSLLFDDTVVDVSAVSANRSDEEEEERGGGLLHGIGGGVVVLDGKGFPVVKTGNWVLPPSPKGSNKSPEEGNGGPPSPPPATPPVLYILLFRCCAVAITSGLVGATPGL
jgi:hypothetical protein